MIRSSMAASTPAGPVEAAAGLRQDRRAAGAAGVVGWSGGRRLSGAVAGDAAAAEASFSLGFFALQL